MNLVHSHLGDQSIACPCPTKPHATDATKPCPHLNTQPAPHLLLLKPVPHCCVSQPAENGGKKVHGLPREGLKHGLHLLGAPVGCRWV
jgi:hypothetical protein